jgi:alkylated DNA repair dioxygenase AlkB
VVTSSGKEPPQLSLFEPETTLPAWMRYQPDLISPEFERQLVRELERLPLSSFEFQGLLGKRRVHSFGWEYNFNDRVLRPAAPLPSFLEPVRAAAAAFAGLSPDDLSHLLVTEYADGAGIGWHKDKGVFGDVIGISLVSPCRFRLRRKVGSGWERTHVDLAPRSAYLLRGLSRTEWEHSIAETESLRYSLTFRTLLRQTRP